MKKFPIVVSFLVFCLTTTVLAGEEAEKKRIYRDLLGEDVFLTIGLPTGFITGHNIYRIAFDSPWAAGGHCESELKWPINNFFLGAELNVAQKNPQNHRQDKARLNVTWFVTVNEATGKKMQDSDWVENDVGFLGGGWQQEGKDIYSESNVDLLRGHRVDVNYIYNFWPFQEDPLESGFENFSLGFGPVLGYRYNYFSHACKDVEQIGYGPYAAGFTYTDPDGRTWVKYKIREHIFYAGGSTDLLLGKNIMLNVKGGYIPFVWIRDEDTHMYPTNARTMISTGDAEGYGWLADTSLNWEFQPDLLAEVGAEYLDIRAEGNMEQKNYWHNIPWWSAPAAGIKEWVKTSYWTFSGKIRFKF